MSTTSINPLHVGVFPLLTALASEHDVVYLEGDLYELVKKRMTGKQSFLLPSAEKSDLEHNGMAIRRMEEK